MNGFLTWEALVMFALGVVLSASVKSLVGKAKSKVGA